MRFDKSMMDLAGKSSKVTKAHFKNQINRMGKMNSQMGSIGPDNRLDRVDIWHDVMKTRDPVWRGLFGLASGNQAKTNPVYLGLEKAIRNKGATPIQFNPDNIRGRDLLTEAQLYAKAGKQNTYSHTVMGHFGVKNKKFYDVWDFAQNNPGKTKELQNEIMTNLVRDPGKSWDSTKQLTTRHLRGALDSRINPITIEGRVI